MNYKLMVFDIDGTLVPKDHIMSDRTKKVLTDLKNRGIKLGLASGRSLEQLKNHAKSWNLDFEFDLLIGVNGARLYDNINKQRYDLFDLKVEWVKEIVEMMEPFHLNCHAYHETYTIYYKYDSTVETAKKRYSTRKIIVANSIEEMYTEEVPKIMYKTKIENSKEIEEYAQSHCNENYKVVRTTEDCLEFVAKDCSKGYALNMFCELNNISLKDVIAFGDTSNDNDMLIISGLGVCLLNGSEDTKKIADAITEKTYLEDGVADFIEKLLEEH